jgi:hypothetical protein
LLHVGKDVLDKVAQLAATPRPGGGRGALIWPGLLRRLERRDPTYAS